MSSCWTRPARRKELEGVVVGREKYGVNVRLADGTIRGFSDVEVSPAFASMAVSRPLREPRNRSALG